MLDKRYGKQQGHGQEIGGENALPESSFSASGVIDNTN
jgi:hypothetical protein